MANTMEAPAETAAPEQQKRKPHIGRRAFLATAATVTACGAGALAAPKVIPALESKAQEMGRDAVLNEIGSLEGRAMSLLHLNTSVLDAFRDVVTSWQGGVASLPIALDTYTTADIDSGERYLRALKQMAEHPHVG
jgi:hypothetical protein